MSEIRFPSSSPRRHGWRFTLLAFGVLALLVGSCNWMTPRHPEQLRQGLMVRCNRPKAVLYINERMVGTLGTKTSTRVGLMPGSYRVAVRLPGYFTRYLDVKIAKEKYQKLLVVLRPELD